MTKKVFVSFPLVRNTIYLEWKDSAWVLVNNVYVGFHFSKVEFDLIAKSLDDSMFEPEDTSSCPTPFDIALSDIGIHSRKRCFRKELMTDVDFMNIFSARFQENSTLFPALQVKELEIEKYYLIIDQLIHLYKSGEVVSTLLSSDTPILMDDVIPPIGLGVSHDFQMYQFYYCFYLKWND